MEQHAIIDKPAKHMLMDKPNVFVYDVSRGFSRFVKSKYGNHFNIEVCANVLKFEERCTGSYDYAFISIDNYADAMVFVKLSRKAKFIFVYSRLNYSSRVIPTKSPNVVLLTAELLRSEMTKIIDAHIGAIQFELQELKNISFPGKLPVKSGDYFS